MFWRQSAETLARHRNPIFDEALGLAPEKTLCIDILHALNLGVFGNFCHCALRAVVNNGAWGRRACADETVAAATLAIRNELKVFYRAWALEHPTSPLTRIAFKTMVDPSSSNLPTKVAETWGFLLFLEACLNKHHRSLGRQGKAMLRATRALIGMVTCRDEEGPCMRPATAQTVFDHWNTYLAATRGMELETPKRHIVAHLLEKSTFLGNPRRHAAWLDEALNKYLKLACRTVRNQHSNPSFCCACGQS